MCVSLGIEVHNMAVTQTAAARKTAVVCLAAVKSTYSNTYTYVNHPERDWPVFCWDRHYKHILHEQYNCVACEGRHCINQGLERQECSNGKKVAVMVQRRSKNLKACTRKHRLFLLHAIKVHRKSEWRWVVTLNGCMTPSQAHPVITQ